MFLALGVGMFCTMLLYHLVAHIILFCCCEDPAGK